MAGGKSTASSSGPVSGRVVDKREWKGRSVWKHDQIGNQGEMQAGWFRALVGSSAVRLTYKDCGRMAPVKKAKAKSGVDPKAKKGEKGGERCSILILASVRACGFNKTCCNVVEGLSGRSVI